MKNTVFSRVKLLLVATFVLASVCVVTGCLPQNADTSYGTSAIEDTSLLLGKWIDSSNASFEISKTALDNKWSGGDSYAGDNLCVIKLTETSGILYLKFTRAAKPDWTYSTDKNEAPDVGRWYAVAYKDLTAKSAFIAGAYKEGGKSATDTLEEAVTEFTLENGYFDFTYAAHSKVTE